MNRHNARMNAFAVRQLELKSSIACSKSVGMPKDIFTTRAPRDVVEALTRAGFSDARIERPESHTPWTVIVATRWARGQTV